jgi:agmatine/peptidylarginine deiminase
MAVNPGSAFELNPVTAPGGEHDDVQVKSVLATLEVRLMAEFVPEQIVFEGGLLETSGVGLTVTT